MNLAWYDVTTVIHAHLILSNSMTTDVAIELGYRAADPYAVQANFTANGSTTKWLLARDLFGQGLVATQDAGAGEGNVCIWRDEDPDYVLITLTGAPGTALLAAPAEPIERFVNATHKLVPFGSEGDRVGAEVGPFVASILTV